MSRGTEPEPVAASGSPNKDLKQTTPFASMWHLSDDTSGNLGRRTTKSTLNTVHKQSTGFKKEKSNKYFEC